MNQETELKNHKRAKTTVAYLKPTAKIEGNRHPINVLKWINNSEIVSGGYDHAIRIFDVDKEKVSQSIFTNNKTTTCLDSIKSTVLVGSEDHYVRLWDIRSKSTEPVKVFKGHDGWVSTVKLNPNSDYHFISSGYDSRTLVWDFR
jgi:WD40 repeat protein